MHRVGLESANTALEITFPDSVSRTSTPSVPFGVMCIVVDSWWSDQRTSCSSPGLEKQY